MGMHDQSLSTTRDYLDLSLQGILEGSGQAPTHHTMDDVISSFQYDPSYESRVKSVLKKSGVTFITIRTFSKDALQECLCPTWEQLGGDAACMAGFIYPLCRYFDLE